MDSAVALAVTSLAVAAFAAAFSLWSAWTAQRAHRLARAQEDERTAPLKLYLADGYGQRDKASGKRRYAFLLSVTNSAAANNTISRIQLRVHFRSQSHHLAMIDVSAAGSTDFVPNANSAPHLVAPIQLTARESAAGWVAFEVPGSALADQLVDLYEVRLTDAFDRVATWKVAHVTEVYPHPAS